MRSHMQLPDIHEPSLLKRDSAEAKMQAPAVNAVRVDSGEKGEKPIDEFGCNEHDRNDMDRMGKQQQLRRIFRQFSLICFAAISMATWEFVLIANDAALTDGGRGGFFWTCQLIQPPVIHCTDCYRYFHLLRLLHDLCLYRRDVLHRTYGRRTVPLGIRVCISSMATNPQLLCRLDHNTLLAGCCRLFTLHRWWLDSVHHRHCQPRLWLQQLASLFARNSMYLLHLVHQHLWRGFTPGHAERCLRSTHFRFHSGCRCHVGPVPSCRRQLCLQYL